MHTCTHASRHHLTHAHMHTCIPELPSTRTHAHMQGMTLDTVLGKGSYGVAYHAMWHGMEVVVKIQTQKLQDSK